MAQVIKHLPGKRKYLTSNPELTTPQNKNPLHFLPGTVAHTCYPRTWEAEARGSQVRGCILRSGIKPTKKTTPPLKITLNLEFNMFIHSRNIQI
jgi:hypothetical protein